MIKVVVLHQYHGCDTGCCGHVVRLNDENGQELGDFEFSHPYGPDRKKWALDFARQQVEAEYGEGHAFDLDWDNCSVDC